MKKSALRKDLIREICRTRARFISIFLLITLAVAFFAGLRTTEPDMKKSAEVYADECGMYDIRIVSTLGIAEEDIEAAKQLPDVEMVEGGRALDILTSIGEKTLAIKTMSISDNINIPSLVEGRLPNMPNECLADSWMGVKIGDKISIDINDDNKDNFSVTEFVVVGKCNTPLYLSFQRGTTSVGNGSLDGYIYVPMEAYDMDYYTDLYFLLEGGASINSFEKAYEGLVESFKTNIEDWADERAAIRTNSVRTEALAKLAEGKSEYEDAKSEADEKLADAESEILNARNTLDDGWKSYNDGLQALNDSVAAAEIELRAGETELNDALNSLTNGEQELFKANEEYKKAEADYLDGYTKWENGSFEYEEGLRLWNEQNAQYEQNLKNWNNANDKYNEMLNYISMYDAAVADYEAGKQQVESSLAEWQNAWNQVEISGQESTELGIQLQEWHAQLLIKQAELENAKTWIDDNSSDAEELRALAIESESSLGEQRGLLEIYKNQLASKKEELDAASMKLEESKQILDKSKELLDQGLDSIEENRARLNDGWNKYYQGIGQLESAEGALRDKTLSARAELNDAEQKLKNGEIEYNDAIAELENAKAEANDKISDAEKKLQEAENDIREISDAEWYILDRNTNAGYVNYSTDAENMGNLANVFPLIFFLVAALVVLTTMTRMVEDQRITIGSMKALGYSAFDVSKKFVGYGFLASFFGSVFGLALGCTVIPYIIISCWKIMYSIPAVRFQIYPVVYAVSAGAAIAITTFTVLAATLNALRATPASLMRPKTPKSGKRIFLERINPIWKRLSFTQKVTARNLLRYKKRFWMTVAGIGGCTALVITGLGLNDSISNVLGIQYKEVTQYHASANLDKDKVLDAVGILEENDRVADYCILHVGTMDIVGNKSTASGTCYTVDSSYELDGMINLRTRIRHEPVAISNDGILICEKLSNMLGVKTGDTVVLEGDTRVEAKVAGVVENYVQNYIYISTDYYLKLFHKTPEKNTVLIKFDEDSPECAKTLGQELLSDDAVKSFNHLQTTKDSIESSFGTINYAVFVVIISAAALAFVVLFNLSNINITERRRELATLQVLGFRDKEMNAYVLRENIVLTLIGSLVGLLMGKWLHAFVVKTVEVEIVMFGPSADVSSYVMAVVLTFVFSIIVNIIAGKKLRKIDMIESLKGVE